MHTTKKKMAVKRPLDSSLNLPLSGGKLLHDFITDEKKEYR